MIVSHKLQYIYPRISKTGTLSISNWLKTNYHGIEYGKYHNYEIPKEWSHYFKFVTIRDPFERIYSVWRYQVARKDKKQYSFEEVCQRYAEGTGAPFSLLQTSIIDYVNPDWVVRLEKLARGLSCIPFYKEHLGKPRHVRKTPGKHVGGFFGHFGRYSNEHFMVADLFQEDFKLLGYSTKL